MRVGGGVRQRKPRTQIAMCVHMYLRVILLVCMCAHVFALKFIHLCARPENVIAPITRLDETKPFSRPLASRSLFAPAVVTATATTAATAATATTARAASRAAAGVSAVFFLATCLRLGRALLPTCFGLCRAFLATLLGLGWTFVESIDILALAQP